MMKAKTAAMMFRVLGIGISAGLVAMDANAVEVPGSIDRARGIDVYRVQALWLHAANGNYTDDASLQALQRLSEDIDSKVSEVALTALNDIQQYQDATK